MKSWSLKRRLGLQTLFTVASIISLFGASAYFALNHAAERYFQTRLEHDAEMLLGALRFDNNKFYLADGVNQPIFEAPYSGHYYQIEVEHPTYGKTQLNSLSLDNNLLSSKPLITTDNISSTTTASNTQAKSPLFNPLLNQFSIKDAHYAWLDFPNNQYLYLIAYNDNRPLDTLENVTISMQVAEDFAPVKRIFGWALLILFIVFFLAALIWIVILQRLLKYLFLPFDKVKTQLQELTVQQREALDSSPMEELQPLVKEINHLGVRTRERLARARLATGNLSHALKTPLSIITNRLDLPLSAQGEQEQKECQQQLKIIRNLIDRELKYGRVAGLMSRGQALDMVTLFEQLKMTMNKLHPQQNIQLNTPKQLDFPGDREDMMELFGNLLDNACKWANQQVMIQLDTLSASGIDDNNVRVLRVCICDDGPGVASEELPRLQHPGERLDESTSGHGLGLAIVADIIKQYGGQCNFSNKANCLNTSLLNTDEVTHPENRGLQVCVQIPYPSSL
tara:strand:+ start:1676 stop:3202 length:1527 start_codon:yes stop_codon:yes gene_type:complete